MKKTLVPFIDKIKGNTGIELTVFDKNGAFICGLGDSDQTVPTNFDGVIADVKNNRTLFKIKFKNERLVAMLLGTSQAEKNYALFITELAEKELGGSSDISREGFYRALLDGSLSAEELQIQAKRFNLYFKTACVMIIETLDGKIGDVADVLLNYGGEGSGFLVPTGDTTCAFVKFADQTSGEYRSFAEFAVFLVHSAFEERSVSIRVFIGNKVEKYEDVALSYEQARYTFSTANKMGINGTVQSFSDYFLIRVLEDLPEENVGEYRALLKDEGAKEIFDNPEMLLTADAFIENSLNVSETARKLFLHRNTLIYRLDKIERQTGLNIRRFTDAVAFRLITILSKLFKG